MDDIQEKKRSLRSEITKKVNSLTDEERAEKTQIIENSLFEFANFVESKIPLLYISSGCEVSTQRIFRMLSNYEKILVLPSMEKDKHRMKLLKVDDLKRDLKINSKGILEPDPSKCKPVPIDCIDIALIPGIAFDEKGGRLGTGDGYYDRLIPRLPITARKVSLTFECQMVPQVPMVSHDKHVDIIITENRIIYKI